MFIDEARIHVLAGHGGRGSVSFRREKFVPRGGPDGGDGGKGGDIYLQATSKKNTLLDFRYKRVFKARRGEHGMGSDRTGKSAEDTWIPVPVGTVVYDLETEEQIADLDQDGAIVLLARGGRGGKGNAHFVTATRQAPEYAQEGTLGEEKRVRLELKLLADVGLLGLPNAGKSTLLSRISAARPKIAAYPFTTLNPLLGVARVGDSSFVVADIPGLIEGASQGHGLGLQFLRHVERTRILLHLLDVSGEPQQTPSERYYIIRKELEEYGRGLSAKPEIIVATKIDSAQTEAVQETKKLARNRHVPFAAISAVTGEGLPELLQAVQDMLGKKQ